MFLARWFALLLLLMLIYHYNFTIREKYMNDLKCKLNDELKESLNELAKTSNNMCFMNDTKIEFYRPLYTVSYFSCDTDGCGSLSDKIERKRRAYFKTIEERRRFRRRYSVSRNNVNLL